MQQSNNRKYLMALCKDKPEDPIDFGYTLYFVNNTEDSVESLRIKPEAILKEYDNEIQGSQFKVENFILEPRSYTIISNIDEMDLPFNVAYDTYIKSKDTESRKSLDINQLGLIEMKPEAVPVLNKYGYVFAIN